MDRHKKLNELLLKKKIDAMLISNPANIFYYSGFKGTNATLLIFKEHKYLVTDFRYKEQAELLDNNYKVVCTSDDESLISTINNLKKKLKFESIGLEGDTLTRNEWLTFERHLTARLIDCNIDGIRQVKDQEEVSLIKQAIRIAEQAFQDTLDVIEVGKTELEVARYLENKMLEYGAESLSFTTIVASGERGSLPHGVASNRRIKNNELITFDFGCKYKGYCSDLTRTIAVGTVDQNLLDIYDTVLEANLLGIKHTKAGLKGSQIDRIVRDFIDSKGYKGMFGHGLGHSIGIDVHEDPRLRPDDHQVLEVGNVITIEPGIYLPGVGGVRIEDDVLITENGHEVLTHFTKELIII